ncbi:hypothetical protein DPMN_028299 [Dreissena polymorpha]|uniref:Uncharacterized protein n=1 Tax=Dreissena polymorpha TaxID=45954 RepID=A0A9D4RGC9_DREPO|nr:hypothetical protein DPMN_028299 [Dreissena polymorpha]
MAASGLEEEQQRTWISTITEMIDEGPKMILRLPKIRQAILNHFNGTAGGELSWRC